MKDINDALQYIKNHSLTKFQRKMQQNQIYTANHSIFLALKLFPLYLLLCSTVFLGNPEAINTHIYHFLKYIHFPVRTPHGWNLSYVIAITLNAVQGFYLLKNTRTPWARRLLRYRTGWMLKYWLIYRPFFFLIFVLFLSVLYAGTLPARSATCTVYSLCFMQSDSLFLYSSFVLYVGAYFTCFMLYLMVTHITYKHTQLRRPYLTQLDKMH